MKVAQAFTRVVPSLLLAGTLAMPAASETLTDALVLAYNNSDLLEQSRAILRSADEDVAQAIAELRPTLNYSANREWTFRNQNEVFIDNDGVTNTLGLTTTLTLYEFGRNRIAVEAAKEAVLAARSALLSQEQAVLFSAVEAYMEVRRSQDFVELRQNNVRVLREELRAANDRFEVGEVTRTDVAQAEARLAAAEANLVVAQGDLSIAREQYNLAVGRYPENLAEPPPLPRTAESEAAARRIAVMEHPQIQQAQRLVNVAELNMVRAERAVLPSVDADASVVWSDNVQGNQVGELDRSAQVGLQISGPIYRGGAINSLYRDAVAQRDENRAQLLRTTSQISEQVGRAWAVAEVDEARLGATERQIEAARVAFEGTREEATLGARTTLDVLNAEQELLDAQGERIEALARLQVAAYGVLSAMGRLTVDYLDLPVAAYDPSLYYNAVRNAPTVASEQGIQLDRVLKRLGRF